MPTFDHEVTLAYDDSGADERTPLLFLHGLSSARTTWALITPAFASHHRIVTLDHRGHGDSGHAPGTYVLANYTADTVAFCEQVIGGPSIVVGHSLGGVMAFNLARTRPDLVLGVFLEDPPLYVGDLDTPPPADQGVAQFFPILRQVLSEMQQRNAPFDDYLTMLQNTPAMNGAGTLADVLGSVGAPNHARAWASLDPEVFTPAIDGTALAGAEPDAPLTRPAMVLRADPALGAAFSGADETCFLGTNPTAAVALFEGASHLAHDEQPDRFVDELGRFLGSVRSDS